MPDAGTIIADGIVIDTMDENTRCLWRREKLGFVYQFYHLPAEFSLLENVMMPVWIAGTRDPEARSRAVDLLQAVGLGRRLNHKPAELSGGEQQRVAICRALVTKPRLVLADEATGNLDAHTAAFVADILLRLNQQEGATLIVATHDLEFAQRFDDVYRLCEGVLNPV